jgi:hypothetical protein
MGQTLRILKEKRVFKQQGQQNETRRSGAAAEKLLEQETFIKIKVTLGSFRHTEIASFVLIRQKKKGKLFCCPCRDDYRKKRRGSTHFQTRD